MGWHESEQAAGAPNGQGLEDELREEQDISLLLPARLGSASGSAAPPYRWNESGYVHAEAPSGREPKDSSR
jgi:hypothetical protein